MGRPRKQTVDYFPHFVSTDSRTRFILEDGWGNDGYAFWFKLLELLCRSEGHYYDCSETANEKYLVALMKMEQENISKIIETLVDLGNIDKELWEEHKIIWCQSLVDCRTFIPSVQYRPRQGRSQKDRRSRSRSRNPNRSRKNQRSEADQRNRRRNPNVRAAYPLNSRSFSRSFIQLTRKR